MSEQGVVMAAIQMAMGEDRTDNVERAEGGVREAAEAGAQVILLPELFEGPYFCREESDRFFDWALPAEGHPMLDRFARLAAELQVVLPISFFERDGTVFYNSLAVFDADGARLGVYRKSHIPDGPGYEEKFYFRPGNTGFRVWATRHGHIGVGICWDQWFPEAARAMVLAGADVLLYPTAIGSEPEEPELDTRDPWRRAMAGHAVCNVCPVVAANRVGDEQGQLFYGSSFIADERGGLVAELDRTEEGVILAAFDLHQLRRHRASFGLFRDRRPDLYGALVQ